MPVEAVRRFVDVVRVCRSKNRENGERLERRRAYTIGRLVDGLRLGDGSLGEGAERLTVHAVRDVPGVVAVEASRRRQAVALVRGSVLDDITVVLVNARGREALEAVGLVVGAKGGVGDHLRGG